MYPSDRYGHTCNPARRTITSPTKNHSRFAKNSTGTTIAGRIFGRDGSECKTGCVSGCSSRDGRLARSRGDRAADHERGLAQRREDVPLSHAALPVRDADELGHPQLVKWVVDRVAIRTRGCGMPRGNHGSPFAEAIQASTAAAVGRVPAIPPPSLAAGAG